MMQPDHDPFEQAAAREVELRQEQSDAVQRRARRTRNYALASLQGFLVLAILFPVNWLAFGQLTGLWTANVILLAVAALAAVNWWIQHLRTRAESAPR